MGSKPSSQPVSETEVIQKIGETSQLSLLPEDVLIRILKLLDMKTLVSRLFLTCKLFCPSFEKCSVVQHPFLAHLGHIYEPFMFSKGDLIQPIPTDNSQQIPKENFQPCYFRSNVKLSLKEIKQPAEMRLHVFTISDSKEIPFDEIVSMVIELPNNAQSDIQTEALKFLENIVKNSLKKLKNLRLSGFLLNDSLFVSLSKLSLDWLHLIHPVSIHGSSHIPLDLTSALGFTRLHMKLREDCNLFGFPKLPSSLEEFSLHISSRGSDCNGVSLRHCASLKKM